MKKNIITFLLCFTLVFAVSFSVPVQAADIPINETSSITYLSDGSYYVTTIRAEYTTAASSQKQTSGFKSIAKYNSSNEIEFSLTVHGTFTYDGTTSKAVSASYSYTIDDSFWSFSNGSAAYSGNTATATGTFKYLLLFQSQTLTVSLSCSPTGVLS